MSIKKTLLVTASLIVIILVGSILLIYNFSGATKYCPLSHKFNPDMNCRIHDELNGRILIEHFNVDTNKLELSIFKKSEMIWIQHPYGKLGNYNPSIEENTLLFSKSNNSSLIVNDSTFSITVLDKH